MSNQAQMPRTKYVRPARAASDLSVTEFLTLSRVGFLPHGLVIGSCIYDAGFSVTWGYGEVTQLSVAMRKARHLAVKRMRDQAKELGAEGVVGVRLDVEHHTWRGGHVVAKFVAVGTAIAFDHEHGPEEFQHAPPLMLQGGKPFTSDLSGQDFVMLLRAGYRPVDLAMGCCVQAIDPSIVDIYRLGNQNEEIPQYTQALFDAREVAMERLAEDLFKHWPPGHPDSPVGVVGMSVDEMVHAGGASIIEYSAIGTAVAPLLEHDPRRAKQLPAPTIVVPLDR
jgi:uncharacterized protein YbjQ (UPF0145 family)